VWIRVQNFWVLNLAVLKISPICRERNIFFLWKIVNKVNYVQ
jgi:hypothetical protein